MPVKLYARDEYGYTEQLRLFMAEAGIRYEEVTLSAQAEEQMRKDGKLVFNQLPMLEYDGFCVCESAAILEHLAVKADEIKAGRANTYLGGNENERSLARSLAYGANELRRQLYELYLVNSPKQNQDKFTKEVLPAWLQHLNRLAVSTEANDVGLGPGVSFTFGDVAMYEALLQLHTHFGTRLLENYRELKAYYDRCDKRTRFRVHIDNRPKRTGGI